MDKLDFSINHSGADIWHNSRGEDGSSSGRWGADDLWEEHINFRYAWQIDDYTPAWQATVIYLSLTCPTYSLSHGAFLLEVHEAHDSGMSAVHCIAITLQAAFGYVLPSLLVLA